MTIMFQKNVHCIVFILIPTERINFLLAGKQKMKVTIESFSDL